uniref:Uncharacterized protein n=1 Tax=Leersia perrieri TaxID=77586 RepID=A0A0D9XGB9_9ORYZ
MTETEQELLKPSEELIQEPSSTFVEATNFPVKTTLSATHAHAEQINPTNYSSGYTDGYDVDSTMQFKDAASAARAAAESAERAASAAKAAADLVNKRHSSDEVEDRRTSFHESTHSSKRQSMSNSSRSSRKEDVVAFDELNTQGRRASHTGSFIESNHIKGLYKYSFSDHD